jgi:hypothetical protein
MSSKNIAVFGVYPSTEHSERAVDTFIAAGYPTAAVSVLLPNSSEYEAKCYAGRVKNGRALLSVHCDSSEQISRAKNLLKGTFATDIASTSEVAGGS